ncbi:bifunctional DNA-formamidopyrimidine glycosylase/DNA-(apurinic or apyrimidinic site) lyase [Salinibacterium sp. G-O1]|uniref:bifunctional DNA-formamidopyrimidine glycosylase/DNA-(apurinic or apyrimidinic site) lyase n=1 Tax=Salinibacterium sp. G-O1 TaxID=3046208 RepID=UPI0024B9B386|nr:bifunctional DNA-formamidopyrimidine glycosylase/DNA-(apurinic or apyrimidinic site) lyase [Salinibacterium sp. G-O1]MDJ0335706.1 bifunctional DNA-formamidopyrimidine glycosylase/DNA-(apurinic or apyrimidinic site) lyase [Salinibacterium sp. G-O1]
MPELPEVEVVRAGLEPAVTGARVESVTVFDERSLRRHDGPAEDFIDRLTGRTMLAPLRRGKFMWIPLSPPPQSPLALPPPPRSSPPPSEIQEIPDAAPVAPGQGRAFAAPPSPGVSGSPEFPTEALVTHLGMSGQVLLRDTATDDARTRIRVDLRHPEHGPLRLNFVDQRIFGSMAIDGLVPSVDGGDSVPSKVVHIARDPLDERFNDALFLTRLARKNTTVKRAMLDQTLISGIGNIYADEALWAARVHYDQPTGTLSRARAKLLLAEVRLVLRKALAEGGTSFDAQYLNVNGQSGYFAHSLNAYGRQGESCPRCGRPIIRESFMNRGSHFCAHCQRVR